MEWLSLIPGPGLMEPLRQFMSHGGPVLWWLAGLVFLFWFLAVERVIFLLWLFPKKQQLLVEGWRQRCEQHSWYAQRQRDSWLSQAHDDLFRNLNLLKLIVTLFPMLGLLGTVTGMISVFDVLALEGSSQPRLMASGISMATLPTMAGLVAALVGMFAYSRIRAVCEKRELRLEKLMRSRI